MRFYTRVEITQLLELETGFVETLEREEIIEIDAPAEGEGDFSELMLERVRVTQNLLHDLDVNLAGAAIIVRMREDISGLRHQLEDLLRRAREQEPKGS